MSFSSGRNKGHPKNRRDRRYRNLLSTGIDYVRAGNHAAASDHLTRATKIKNDDPTPWLWLSLTTKDPKEQLHYLEHAVAADPFDQEARTALAKFRVETQGAATPAAHRETAAEHTGEPAAAAAATFKCTHCGGQLVYQPAVNALVCEQCGTHFEVDARSETSDENVLAYALVTERGHRWAESHHLVHCSQCGGESLLPPTQKTNTCPYCGSDQVIDSSETSGMLNPDGIIPMRIKADKAAQIFSKWLGSGFFVPDDLSKMAKKSAIRPAYYPFWTFDATFRGNWSAEVNNNSNWMPISGEQILFYDDILVPGNSRITLNDLKRIEPFDLEKLRDFKPEVLAGWAAFAYDKSLADASLDGRARITKDARAKTRRKASAGKQIRNFRLSMGDFSSQTYKHILLPLWVGIYHYKDREFHVLINGQTGKIGGRKPIDRLKVWLLVAGAATTLIFIALLYIILANLGPQP